MNLRYLWRSVASVLVLLFALCPTLCYASETATTESAIMYSVMPLNFDDTSTSSGAVNSEVEFHYYNDSSWKGSLGYITYTGVGSNYTASQYFRISSSSNSIIGNYNRFAVSHKFRMADGSYFVESGTGFTFTLSGIDTYVHEQDYYSGSGSPYYVTKSQQDLDDYIYTYSGDIHVLFNSNDGQSKELLFDKDDCYSYVDGTLQLVFDIPTDEIDFDIYSIKIHSIFSMTGLEFVSFPHTGVGYQTILDFHCGYSNSNLQIEFEDENTGLLRGIIEWLKSIRDGIVGVKDGVNNVVNGITQLPSKIWTAMENGIKGLFVPTEAQMVEYKDKWDTLLSERFGVVYQSGTLITDTLGTITEQSAQGTINMPATTIHFADTDFTFGGYDVAVVPEGFEWLVDIVKGLIDIVVTVAFINAMRTKYDQLMRG